MQALAKYLEEPLRLLVQHQIPEVQRLREFAFTALAGRAHCKQVPI
jgi:hypothetical protein